MLFWSSCAKAKTWESVESLSCNSAFQRVMKFLLVVVTLYQTPLPVVLCPTFNICRVWTSQNVCVLIFQNGHGKYRCSVISELVAYAVVCNESDAFSWSHSEHVPNALPFVSTAWSPLHPAIQEHGRVVPNFFQINPPPPFSGVQIGREGGGGRRRGVRTSNLLLQMPVRPSCTWIVYSLHPPCNVVMLLCDCIKCGITCSNDPCHLHDAPGQGQVYGLWKRKWLVTPTLNTDLLKQNDSSIHDAAVSFCWHTTV